MKRHFHTLRSIVLALETDLRQQHINAEYVGRQIRLYPVFFAPAMNSRPYAIMRHFELTCTVCCKIMQRRSKHCYLLKCLCQVILAVIRC